MLEIRKKLFLSKIQFIKKYSKGKYWLDVGAAVGAALSCATSEGFRASGIEVSKTSVEFAKKYLFIDLYHGNLNPS